MVTDLDGHLTERALTSLRAELRRRERILHEAGAKDIEDYWRLDDTSNPPLARLTLVIDEFASLVEELPDFMDGLVDIGRRGRSLGIHLILATQRPSGVVSPAIKTNTNLRIAMRVTDAADSVDVIDSPLSSRIAKDTPGRGYVRVGHENLTEFQAARIGQRRRTASADTLQVTSIEWEDLGSPLTLTSDAQLVAEETELSELVRAINAASLSAQIPTQRSPWLDPLPRNFVLEAEQPPEEPTLVAPYALEDQPSLQARGTASLDIRNGGHLLAIGDPGSGRSMLLRTLAGSIALSCPADDVHLFGIDCGNGALLPLTQLRQCGAVVSRTEPDRVDRLITRLLEEIGRRQQTLARGGFATMQDQREANPSDSLPYIVVLLDRWEGFVAEFDSIDGGRLISSFQHIAREARGVGIRLVVTGDRSALSPRVSSLFEEIVLLRLNDKSSYAAAGLNPRKLPDRIDPGRGYRAQSGTELQIAMLGLDPSGPSQVDAFQQIAGLTNARNAAVPEAMLPAPIAVLPQLVEAHEVFSMAQRRADSDLSILVGVGGDRLRPEWVDLVQHGPGFIIGGHTRSGRSNALLVIGRSILDQEIPLVIVTPRPSTLSRLVGHPLVTVIEEPRTARADDVSSLFAGLGPPAVVLIDDVDLLVDAPITEALVRFLRGAADRKSAIVAGGNTSDMATGFRGLVPEIRKSKSGILLCPGIPQEGELLGIRLPKTAIFPGPLGRAVLSVSGRFGIIQVPLDTPVTPS